MTVRGVLPIQRIRGLIADGVVTSSAAVEPHQLQPNSLDLTLGTKALRTRCSFLPVHESMSAMLSNERLVMGELDLTLAEGALFECNAIYIVPLRESLALPPSLHCRANPKSSTGRLDILARLITENGHEFDTVPAGYTGPLYLEVVCRSFPVRLRAGDSLAQIRFNEGNPVLTDEELRALIRRDLIVRDLTGVPIPATNLQIDDGVFLTVRLVGTGDETVGFYARKHTPTVDFQRHDHPISHYWERIRSAYRASDLQIIQENEFYIFASRERLVIPPSVCAEMIAYDSKSGELRTHYAGFFDSGFGVGTNGAHVVLEVRNQDIPFLLQDGQRLFRMRFYWNSDEPDVLYGNTSTRSHYQGQGLKLGKHFSAVDAAVLPQLELWHNVPRPAEPDAAVTPGDPAAPSDPAAPVDPATPGGPPDDESTEAVDQLPAAHASVEKAI